MCKKSTYNRFLKIYKFIKNNNTNHSLILSYMFNTKLGARKIFTSEILDNIFIYYVDYDKQFLFSLKIYPNGKIEVLNSKIGQPEIFLAIYEIEQIINNKKYNERDNILEKLFENVGNENFNFFNFTQYR